MKQKAKNSFTVNMSMDELQDLIQSFDNYPLPIEIPFHLQGECTTYEIGKRSYTIRAGEASLQVTAKGDITDSTSEIQFTEKPPLYTYSLPLVVLAGFFTIVLALLSVREELLEWGLMGIFIPLLIIFIGIGIDVTIKWMQNFPAQQMLIPLLMGFLGLDDLQSVLQDISIKHTSNPILRQFNSRSLIHAKSPLSLKQVDSFLRSYQLKNLPKSHIMNVAYFRSENSHIDFDISLNTKIMNALQNIRFAGRIYMGENELRLHGKSDIYFSSITLTFGMLFIALWLFDFMYVATTHSFPFAVLFLFAICTLIDFVRYWRSYQLRNRLIKDFTEHLQGESQALVKEKRK